MSQLPFSLEYLPTFNARLDKAKLLKDRLEFHTKLGNVGSFGNIFLTASLTKMHPSQYQPAAGFT